MDPFEDRRRGSFETVVLPQDKLQKIFNQIEKNLQAKYSDISLPEISWLERRQLLLQDLVIPMTLHAKNRLGAEEHEGLIHDKNEIFKDIAGKPPRRLLVEGNSGYGKTTFALRIISDWSKKQEYVANKFRAVFLISLRNVHGDLEKIIARECDMDDYPQAEVLQTISFYQESVLVILDGLNEMTETTKRDLMPLLKRNKYPYMCVMVTCTPGMFQTELECTTPQSGGRFHSVRTSTREKLPFWSKRIELPGITKEHRIDFIKQYFESSAEKINETVSQKISYDIDFLCECPLFLLLLSTVIERGESSKLANKTDLFKQMINYLMRSNFFADKALSSGQIDIFTMPRQNLLFRFGELALENLRYNKFIFSESEILKRCENDMRFLQAGFLFKCGNYPSYLNVEHYQAVHYSFLEFFASYYLANIEVEQSVSTSDYSFQKEVVSLIEKGLDRDRSCLILPFLANLMGNRADLLFKSLTCWGSMYRADRYPLANMLSEINVTKDVAQSLTRLIPPKWEVDTWNENVIFFQSSSHCSLLQFGAQQKLIHILEWNPAYECSIPDILHIHRIELRLTEEFHINIENYLKKKIQCTELMCHFIRFDETQWENVVNIFSFIQAQKITLGIWGNKTTPVILKIHKELTEGRWQKLEIYRLGLYGLNPNKDRKSLSVLEDLVKREKIKEGIWVELWKDSNVWNAFCGLFNSRIRSDDIESFFKTATNSCLKEVIFISLGSQNFVLDFDQFCKEGKRPWKYLYTDGNVQIKLDRSKCHGYLPIQEIKLSWWKESNTTQSVDVLTLCQNIKRIACRIELIKELVQIVSNNWPGFQTTEEINLKFIKDSVHPTHMGSLSSFKNLYKLSIDLGSLGSSPIAASVASSLITIIPSLSLKMLEILRVTDVNIPFLERILGGILYSDQKKETLQLWKKYDPLQMGNEAGEMPWKSPQKDRLEIEAMKVGFHADVTVNDLKYCLSFILQLLSNRQVAKFSIVDLNSDLEDEVVYYFFAYREQFRILREIEGLQGDDTLRTHRKLNYLGLIRDRITLTYAS